MRIKTILFLTLVGLLLGGCACVQPYKTEYIIAEKLTMASE